MSDNPNPKELGFELLTVLVRCHTERTGQAPSIRSVDDFIDGAMASLYAFSTRDENGCLETAAGRPTLDLIAALKTQRANPGQ